MAQFHKTLDLWNNNTVEAILIGAIRVNRGQWVQCGKGTKSRLISVNYQSGTFNVVHGSNYQEVNKRFNTAVFHARIAAKRSQMGVF
tara:strand:+ start:18786 stop:19046 length:261 start_codon:yes stop_codon:yes gene_type:complete